MPQAVLTETQADALLFESEGRPTLYSGRDPDPLNLAHSLARHYLISNAQMQARVDAKGHGQIALITAFITRKDMVAAAMLVLNSPVGLWARGAAFRYSRLSFAPARLPYRHARRDRISRQLATLVCVMPAVREPCRCMASKCCWIAWMNAI